MDFFNHIHCKYTGIKGFIKVYNEAIKYQYMIAEKAKLKAKVLVFWERHGLKATLDAFPYKKIGFISLPRKFTSAFQNKLSPLQFIMTLPSRLLPLKLPLESKIGCGYTNIEEDEIHFDIPIISEISII